MQGYHFFVTQLWKVCVMRNNELENG